MSGKAKPNSVVLELIVLAFAKSDVSSVVGTDALRMVTQSELRRMRRGDTLRLQPLWDLLCEQPGFDPGLASPVVCKLQTWEPHLGLEVELPAVLADIDAATVAEWASQIDVSDDELRAALGEGEIAQATTAMQDAMVQAGASPRGKRTSLAGTRAARTTMTVDAPNKKKGLADKLSGLVPVMAIVAVAAFAFAGYSVFGYACGGATVRKVERSLDDIPATDVRAIGTRVGATLSDETWLDRDDREAVLESNLNNLGSEVDGILLLGSDNKLRASAVRQRGSDRIVYYFAR